MSNFDGMMIALQLKVKIESFNTVEADQGETQKYFTELRSSLEISTNRILFLQAKCGSFEPEATCVMS